jgi:MerR family transcriptional regulator, thiopeptide resistance regulator
MSEALKIGELAKRTGLTVRTLHHYDEIRLLKPSLHTDSGHRLYAPADVSRLQRIASLRQLGFSLEEIAGCLDRGDYSPLQIITLQITRLRKQIELEWNLCQRLEALAEHFRPAEEVSVEEFLEAIEAMTMIESYYTPEQLESLKQRREEAAAKGEDITAKGTADWADLMARYTDAMNRGVNPADPSLQALEQRRQELVNAFTGGDPAMAQSLKRLWTEQGDKLSAQYGYDPKLMEYLGKVSEAAKPSS